MFSFNIAPRWAQSTAGAIMLGLSAWCGAQDFPTRAVTTIYPFAPGGGGDAAARGVAMELANLWKQNVVVENRIGGSGILGFNGIRTAKPDGYLLTYLHNGLTVIRRNADPNFTADVGKDYEAVNMAWDNDMVFAANPGAPFKTAKEFIQYVKANPGKVNISIGGLGSTDHITL